MVSGHEAYKEYNYNNRESLPMTEKELTEKEHKEQEFVKVWKTSIPKTELAALPAESFTDKIIVVKNSNDAEKAVAKLQKARFIGFDTETKPSFKRGEHHKVALLQLATSEECFLFRLNQFDLPKSVISLLEDENKLKIGLSVHDDFLSLKKRFKFEPKGFIDLQSFVKNYNIADNSLSRIYGILFDKRISKGQRLSNWEAPELTQAQKEYASLDAKACITIYDHLIENGFDHKKSKYHREYNEPAN